MESYTRSVLSTLIPLEFGDFHTFLVLTCTLFHYITINAHRPYIGPTIYNPQHVNYLLLFSNASAIRAYNIVSNNSGDAKVRMSLSTRKESIVIVVHMPAGLNCANSFVATVGRGPLLQLLAGQC